MLQLCSAQGPFESLQNKNGQQSFIYSRKCYFVLKCCRSTFNINKYYIYYNKITIVIITEFLGSSLFWKNVSEKLPPVSPLPVILFMTEIHLY